jgi:multidrug efflux pump subunit AcrA (membrane-fusion protein)
MTKKILLIFILIAISSVGLYAYQKTGSATKTATKSTAVKMGSLKISFAIDGKTSIERRDLKFTVNGKISRINVKEGQEVKRGQLLMSLDTQDVQKNLQKDLKDFLITRNSFEQTTQVTYPSGGYVDNKDTIKRVLENTQYSLDKSVLDVEIRNIALKESYLYAPIDGLGLPQASKQGSCKYPKWWLSYHCKPGSLYFEICRRHRGSKGQ